MFLPFIKYFFSYICFEKTRQHLLLLSIIGLSLSSFSLLVLQSTMHGLQNSLINRSKAYLGHASLYLTDTNMEKPQEIINYLQAKNIDAYPEYEIELLVRHGNYISPAVVHGIMTKKSLPKVLNGVDLNGAAIGVDLTNKIKLDFSEDILLISPSHTNAFLGDIPRQVTTYVSDVVNSDVPKVDLYHIWTRLTLVQNLTKKRIINKIRIFSAYNFEHLAPLLKEKFPSIIQLKTWEQENSTLVWALKLENMVMIFLFVTMSLLVSISITSGLLIFFGKIKIDLISFWILGSSLPQLERSSKLFLHIISLLAVSLGLIAGFAFLLFIEHFSGHFMPEIFIERRIPVLITGKGIIVSLLVPYIIAVIFSYFSLKNFNSSKDSFISQIRAIG